MSSDRNKKLFSGTALHGNSLHLQRYHTVLASADVDTRIEAHHGIRGDPVHRVRPAASGSGLAVVRRFSHSRHPFEADHSHQGRYLMQKFRKVRFGLVLTLLVCALMVIYRRWVAIGISLFIMAIWGQMRPCPLGKVIGSYVAASHQALREEEIGKRATLIERDPAGYELYELASQRLWLPAGSSHGAILDLAEQERGIYDYDGILLRSGDVVLDAGANIGLYTRHALMLGASKVVAIEPAPGNLECLRRNLKDEVAAERVIVYSKGVWNKEDVLEMNLEPDNPMGDSFVSLAPKATKIKLPVTTIDKLVEELHLERVDIIKMDIEGAEREALAGAANTIRRFRPRMAISVYHLADDPVVIAALISSIRYDYHQDCGICVLAHGWVRPQVYFYY